MQAKLAQRFTVIAPDLLGHGESDKPRADYSLAAFANGMRDLLAVLAIERVTLVGHSLGGGIAAQFSYQYPHMVERLVLVSSGGVTKDVSIALRMAALPSGGGALAALATSWRPTRTAIRRPRRQDPVRLDQIRPRPAGRSSSARQVAGPGGIVGVLTPLRAVVDGRGQYVTMLDRSYLMPSVPKQIIWGEDDFAVVIGVAQPIGLYRQRCTGLALGEFPQFSGVVVVTRVRGSAAERRPALESEPSVDAHVTSRQEWLGDAVQRRRGTGVDIVTNHVGHRGHHGVESRHEPGVGDLGEIRCHPARDRSGRA